MKLVAMNETEFAASFAGAVRRRAKEQVERDLWSSRGAVQASRNEMAQLLPRGQATRGYHFCKIVDGATGAVVGETWYNVRSRGGRTQFWVDLLGVDATYRRKGYGSETLRGLEEEALQCGADRVGLYVFAGNEGALDLYTKRGYLPTGLRLAKELGNRRAPRPGRAFSRPRRSIRSSSPRRRGGRSPSTGRTS